MEGDKGVNFFLPDQTTLRLQGGANMKKSYESPRLVVHGDVEKVTQGTANGNFTDKQFPVDTPKPQLTFS